MKPYFEKMTSFGHTLKKGRLKSTKENKKRIIALEDEIQAEIERVKSAGLPEKKINGRGQKTVWQRIDYLVDDGTWCPLHTLYNPENNPEGTTNVFDGLGKISGRWSIIAGFDNKVMAGAWLPGQSENILRVTDISKRLNIPLVWLVNCSGAKLTEQEKFYANRRGAGTPFFRHAELEQLGIPVLAGIFGTNPAGGGYQSISPAVLFAHKDCNMALGGTGIVSGMSPKGHFDIAAAEEIIEKTKMFKRKPPGSAKVHYDETGFFRYIFEDETGVLDGLKEYMKDMPSCHPGFYRAAEPVEPEFSSDDLYNLIPLNPKMVYDFDQVLARLVDGSEHMEFRPDYGPEIYTGLCKIDGFLIACVGNRQGYLGKNYPEYADYPGMAPNIYRQGLIKMNEFVTLCGRDRIPVAWFQDSNGLDVGDQAEKAELLGIAQSLVYSIQQTDIPMMMILLRKGTASAHYLMGGPTANRHNAFTLGTVAGRIYVMHGETAAVATYSRRLVKEKEAGRPLEPIIEKMNRIVDEYENNSKPLFCAKNGLVDEVVAMKDLRKYLKAFAGAAYQNPVSICPQHHMILPRIIRG